MAKRRVPKKWRKGRRALLAVQGKCPPEVTHFEEANRLPPLGGSANEVPEARVCRYRFLKQAKFMEPHIDHRHAKRFDAWIVGLKAKGSARSWLSLKDEAMLEHWIVHTTRMTERAKKPKPASPPVKPIPAPEDWRKQLSSGYIEHRWAGGV